jgi:hypothetical protein
MTGESERPVRIELLPSPAGRGAQCRLDAKQIARLCTPAAVHARSNNFVPGHQLCPGTNVRGWSTIEPLAQEVFFMPPNDDERHLRPQFNTA